MKITSIEIYKFKIPMVPFTIATGTMDYAQNTLIRIHTERGLLGVGECSAFPMITGETQETCFEMAKAFAQIWKHKDALDIETRLSELNNFAAYNATIKSAFDMALYDLAAKHAGLPLYKYLGGEYKTIETDLTIGIDTPSQMAQTAVQYQRNGVRIIKVKLGREIREDIDRVHQIRAAIGDQITLRIDANQGWDFDDAQRILRELEHYHIQFCEQPLRSYNDGLVPELRKHSKIPIMADESVFNHYDAQRLIQMNACDSINIKFAKSGGIHEALKIESVCALNQIPCMIGGMLESRIALTAFAHFALAANQVVFYDMDTCLLGHLVDPVVGGIRFDGLKLIVPDLAGIGADCQEEYLNGLEGIKI